ncbi:MAG TPA: DEAD/DEAH box helicase family protein [Chloroflexota bacterium]
MEWLGASLTARRQPELAFRDGYLLLRGLAGPARLPPPFRWDSRLELWTAEAWHYRTLQPMLPGLLADAVANTAPARVAEDGPAWETPDNGAASEEAGAGSTPAAVRDRIGRWRPLDDLAPAEPLTLHPAQRAALRAWWTGKTAAGTVPERWGCFELPTGTGKTLLAIALLRQIALPTLVCVPTIQLMTQWYWELRRALGGEIGLLGGGHHLPSDRVTVAVYDSAAIHLERLGDRWAFLVCDEVHHLAGWHARAALYSCAPYRLGLSATLDASEATLAAIRELVGPTVYRADLDAFVGTLLADYTVQELKVRLSIDEQARYDADMAIYRAFLAEHRLQVWRESDYAAFQRLAASTTEGRAAQLAYRRARTLAQHPEAKFEALGYLLRRHAHEPGLIWAGENRVVLEIARRFGAPAIIATTPVRERDWILEEFRAGRLRAIVSNEVLSEGLSIGPLRWAVMVSLRSQRRRSVEQKLGRLLRRDPGKQHAVLYQLVAESTLDTGLARRRRTPVFRVAGRQRFAGRGADRPIVSTAPLWEGPGAL